MTAKKAFNENIVLLRAIAILLVVLGHSIILYDSSWGIYTTTVEAPFFTALKKVINVIQMPLFFSVSGFLFWYSVDKHSFRQLLQTKAKRLLIPYVCIALLWMNPLKIALNVPGYNIHELWPLLKGEILLTGNGHLWFLPCLFMIFIVVFLLHKIIRNDFIVAIILLVAALFHSRLPGVFEMNQTANYVIYFYCGFLSNKLKVPGIGNMGKIAVCLLLFIASILIPVEYVRIPLVALAIFFLYQCRLVKSNYSIVRNISTNSYGIYLFHSPLIYITYTWFKDSAPIFVWFLNFVVMGCVAWGITVLVRRTKLRFLVGEMGKRL